MSLKFNVECSWLGYFEVKFTVAISNKVGLCLGQFEAHFKVAISNVECSRFEGIFIVAINDLVGSR